MFAFGGTAYGDGTDTLTLSNCAGGGTNNDSAFNCASAVDAVSLTENDAYMFLWDYSGISASLDNASDVHIDANDGPNNGLIRLRKRAIQPDPMTPAPEPATGTLALLGLGLLGISFVFRRSHA